MPTADPVLDAFAVAVIFVALAMGGIIKGATGAGAPVVAVPVMAAFFDVRLAVVLMAAPNLITNLAQLYRYRGSHLPGGFSWRFGVAGALGTIAGTAILAHIPVTALSILIAVCVVLYILLRVARPNFSLSKDTARRIIWPVGMFGGIIQGAAGLSAPVSLSFLNAMRIPRETFIATVAAFFAAMAFVQLPALMAFGLLSWQLLALGAAAVIPLLAFMPVGNWLARRLPPKGFDLLILGLLTLLAARLIYTALW